MRCFINGCERPDIDTRGPIHVIHEDDSVTKHDACILHWEAIMLIVGSQENDLGISPLLANV